MLGEDVRAAMERRAQADTQSSRRDVVRTIWAANEGLIWVLREHVVDCANMTHGLKSDEIAVLSETTHNVSSKGVIRAQTKYVSTLGIFRLIARIAKRINPNAAIDFGTSGWNHLSDAQKIRNRITHPKSQQDLFLSDDDIFHTELAFFWLVPQAVECMEKLNHATKDYLGELNAVFGKLQSGDSEVTKLYEMLAEENDI